MRKLIHPIIISVAVCLPAALYTGCSPHAKMARHLERADRYFDSGQYDQAEIEYINVLQIEQLNPQAISRLGIIYFDEGRLGRVMPCLLKARELQPDNLDVRAKLGAMFLNIGKFKEARDEANFVLDRKPQDADTPLLLAGASISAKEIEEARQRLQKLTTAESAPVLVALGTLDFRQRNFKTAEATFKRALALDSKSSTANAAMAALYWAQRDLPHAEQAFAAAAELAPARSPMWLQYAQFKIQTGDLAAGKRLLEEMTQKTPDFLPAWMLRAQIAESEKKYDESTALNAKVLARDPAHPEALLLKSQLDLEKGETSKAVAELESMLKMYPQSPQVNYHLGLAYLVSGETGKATASLNQAVSLAPDFADAVILLAGIHVRMGEPNTAIASLQQVVQHHPDMLRAWLLLADAYRSADDFDKALAVYQQLERLFPHDPQISWLMGLLFVQHNQTAEARQAFSKALDLAPDYLPALEQLVNLDLAEKQYSAALQRLQSPLEKYPSLSGLHLLLGKVFLAQNDTKEAEASLLKAIELQPDSSAAYFMLAQMYVSSNQNEKAVANLKEVLTKKPGDVQTLMLMGVIYDQQKDYAAACATYEKLLATNPNFSPAVNNLAYLYSEHFNQLDKAYAMAQKARELLPHEPHTGDTLGWILFKKRQYTWALSLLEESAAKLPASAEVQFHLGMTHYMMGEEEPARLALQNALRLSNDFPGMNEARQCLSLLKIDVRTAGTDTQAMLEKAVTDRPDDPVALARLAAIYARDGSSDKAISAYQTAWQANPANLSALMNLIRLYSAQHDTARAFELAKTAHKLAPDDPDVTHALGRLTYETNDYPWALSLLQEAARKKSDDPEILYDLAMAAYSMGRINDAQAAMRRALQVNPSFTRADKAKDFLEMVSMSANLQQATAAISKIEQTLQSDPANVPALMAMAAIDGQKSDLAAAKLNYEKVLEHYPDFVPAQKYLTILYAENPSDDAKAFDLAGKTRQTLPDDKEVAKAFGIITYRKGDYARAAVLLQESARQRSEDAELMYYLGMAQYRLKQRAESKQSLQRALDLNLNPGPAADARQILTELK